MGLMVLQVEIQAQTVPRVWSLEKALPHSDRAADRVIGEQDRTGTQMLGGVRVGPLFYHNSLLKEYTGFPEELDQCFPSSSPQ